LVDGPDHAEPSSIEAAAMAFKLVHAKYDRESERAYVELRDGDDDGGEILAVTIFSFRTTRGCRSSKSSRISCAKRATF
jgi:hypothetical protein